MCFGNAISGNCLNSNLFKLREMKPIELSSYYCGFSIAKGSIWFQCFLLARS